MRAEIVQETALAGLANLAERFNEGDDLAFSAALESAIERRDLLLRPTLGRWDGRALLGRLKRRRQVEVLEEERVTVAWFGCHVPCSGSAKVSIEAGQERQASVEVKVFGSALARGRGVALSVVQDTDPRTECAVQEVELLVQPSVYEEDGRLKPEVEIIEAVGCRSATIRSCSFCAATPGAVDPFEYKLLQYEDLRADTVKKYVTRTLVWTADAKTEIGLSIGKIPVSFALVASASETSTWTVSYVLAPGRLHQPYIRLGAPTYHPPYWASGV